MKILVVEDEKEISNAICKVLKHNNYLTDAAYDGVEALGYLEYDEYDGVVLDLMLPKKDGIQVVKELRAKGNNVPVLILTAKSEIDDKVLGLDAGADDYLTKPFSMQEFLARIRSITRRKNSTYSQYKYGNITLNSTTFELVTESGKVRLSNKEYQLLEILINNHNILFSTETLMDKVWGFNTESEINVVWVYISALRKKLSSINANVSITAVRGIGYKFEVIKWSKD